MSFVALVLLPTLLTSTPAPPPPTDAECAALPGPLRPFSFAPGEALEYDIDAMGAVAGKMTMRVMTAREGALPIEVRAQSNSFFSKVRRVTGLATSYLSPMTLRPKRYLEDALENEVRRTADVTFTPSARNAKVDFTIGGRPGSRRLRYANDGLDTVGAVYLLRQLPLKPQLRVCFDAYGIRRLWRVSGEVLGTERVSLPLGEFTAWHISGEAVRLDNHAMRRELHVWITDDPRRLPLVAVGAIDLGVVRATLTSFQRPGRDAARAPGAETFKW